MALAAVAQQQPDQEPELRDRVVAHLNRLGALLATDADLRDEKLALGRVYFDFPLCFSLRIVPCVFLNVFSIALTIEPHSLKGPLMWKNWAVPISSAFS